MASTSSSTTEVTPGADRCRYDVFLSFRGEDTRLAFTDHLYEALVGAGLWTFRDDDEIEKGEDLKPEIKRAITGSRSSIVVLSENYANSTWCLNELLLILEQRRNFNHFVFPVFYHVDPSAVRKQQKSFRIKVNTAAEESEWKRHVDRWEAALTEVADLSGMVVSGYETRFIAKLVNIIHSKLDHRLVSTPPRLIGMGTRAKYINSWLKNEQSHAVLVVWGMGGSGKTTLAKYIYNSNSRHFESSSFLEDIGKSCEQPNGLRELQKQLLRDILGVKKKTISNISEGTRKIEEALQMKRVLIVLDGIDEYDQISAMLGTERFNIKSKIIVTSRCLMPHAWIQSTSRRYKVYGVGLLNDHESLELLSWHAFGSETPREGFKEVAEQVAQYCGGNPLALKVLGSSLFVSAEDGQRQNSIKPWISTLKLLKKDSHSGIQGILRKSFDSLPYSSCKELFLHIACFFIGEDEDCVVKILEPDYSASAGIKILINRCLLTVSPSNKLTMHPLLQEMGKTIIREESPKNPAKRSRVWCDKESYALLKKGKGSETVEGLALDLQKLKKETIVESCALKASSLTKMDNLKLLQLKYVQLTGSFKNFPEELIWLCWHGFPLRTIPSDLFMVNLVAIEMSNSNLEEFEPPREEFHRQETLDMKQEEFHKQETLDMSKASVADKNVESASSSHGETLKSVITSETVHSSRKKLVLSLKVKFYNQDCKRKAVKRLARYQGVEMFVVDSEKGTLTVRGDFHPIRLAFQVRRIVKVTIISFESVEEPLAPLKPSFDEATMKKT